MLSRALRKTQQSFTERSIPSLGTNNCYNLGMIKKETVTKENFPQLALDTARLREDIQRQDEALEDTQTLLDYAISTQMNDAVVELLLESALIYQHRFMEGVSRDESLELMSQAVEHAKMFAETKKLDKFASRIARFEGRVADYKGDHRAALSFYHEAIDKIEADPKYQDNHALAYEYRGFAIFDEIRLGEIEKGIAAAEALHQDYEQTEEGKALREKDYTTWAVWRSGLYINLCRVLIGAGKKDEYKDRMMKWLDQAEADVTPKDKETWADFGFRKNEINRVREDLR